MKCRLLLPLAALLLVTTSDSAAADVAPRDRLLTDFAASGSDLGWYVVNDNVMGGRSRGDFAVRTGVLRFAGSTNTNGGGFSSIRTRSFRADLSAFDGIGLRVKGDGRTYTWRLTTDARYRGRPVSYWADFKTRKGEWTQAAIPFAAFKPQFRGMALRGPALDPRRITGMGLMIYDKRDGPFELLLDRVEAFTAKPAFSLETYRWKRRVLVLFAPSRDDARLARQVADVRATRTAFDERDMALVLVTAGGGSAGEATLTAQDAAALRKTLRVAPGDFALRLIGKDGGTKRASGDAVAMTELYALIDTMPMRKTEMLVRGR